MAGTHSKKRKPRKGSLLYLSPNGEATNLGAMPWNVAAAIATNQERLEGTKRKSGKVYKRWSKTKGATNQKRLEGTEWSSDRGQGSTAKRKMIKRSSNYRDSQFRTKAGTRRRASKTVDGVRVPLTAAERAGRKPNPPNPARRIGNKKGRPLARTKRKNLNSITKREIIRDIYIVEKRRGGANSIHAWAKTVDGNEKLLKGSLNKNRSLSEFRKTTLYARLQTLHRQAGRKLPDKYTRKI